MKFLRFALFAAVLLSFAASVSAQRNPKPTPTVEPEMPADDVIRISSNLVLVDALVVDKDNKQVKDLSAEDFEIYQDGKLQEITSFSYVDGVEKTVTVQKKRADGGDLAPPPVKLGENSLGRVITFVIDDGNCLATIEGTASARDGIKRFIDEQMRPDDKVAIYRTRGGSSLLQMYTSNKEVLKRVVNKIGWSPSRCSSAFEAARDKSTLKIIPGATTFESEADRETRKLISDNENENSVIGTLGVIGFVVDRLRTLPQRKIVFLVSEGLTATFGTRAYDALRDLSDKASRAQVVIYTVPTKGVSVPGFVSSQDEVLPSTIEGEDDIAGLANARADEERALNEGMAYLAYATGGKFLRNRNFIETGIEEVLESEAGYYLLGYEPEDETFDGKKYHQIEIRLKRPGLKLASRKGFIGRNDEAARPRGKDPKNPVYAAIASPFTESNIDLKMTPLVKNISEKGGTVRMLFHLDGQSLSFTDDAGGLKKLILNVVVVALDEKGKVAEEFNRVYPIRVPERAVPTIRENGLEYSTDLKFDKPGVYSLRLAIRDENSGDLGSAGDFVEIPKPDKKRMYVGSFVTTSVAENDLPVVPSQRAVESGFAPVFGRSIPAIRGYRPGSELAYVFDLYIPESVKAAKLKTGLRFYKEGVLVAEMPGPDVDAVKRQRPVEAHGLLRLTPELGPGTYVLQLNVTDPASGRSASSWIDFEVIQ
ncbi:MAG: VWA domain-containing protein [Acidobacteriota bacterium]|nr:MAG: VWA domain-containing protein [Acidobacteriota bacterium]